MDFRQRLLATLRAAEPILRQPGVLIIGSELPNILQAELAATLVVSEDIDFAVDVSKHAAVKQTLQSLTFFHPAPEEPSVWLPNDPGLLEINFLGLDRSLDSLEDSYVLADETLPLLVFGALSLMQAGEPIEIEGLSIPVPRVAGMLVEKLLSERSGRKGDRDLLVVAGLLGQMVETDLEEMLQICLQLNAELRHSVRANLAILSLMETAPAMPDPQPQRQRIHGMLRRLEALEAAERK